MLLVLILIQKQIRMFVVPCLENPQCLIFEVEALTQRTVMVKIQPQAGVLICNRKYLLNLHCHGQRSRPWLLLLLLIRSASTN